MSDISVPWLLLATSPRREALARSALGLAAAVLVATALVRLTDSGWVAVAGAVLAAPVAALARRRARGGEILWCVRGDGQVFVHTRDFTGAAECVFASAGLVVLRHGRTTTAVWRDAAPGAAFRRLCAAARWPAARPRVAPSELRPDATGRT